jgi:Tfp pilus assembly protein PilO
MPSTQEQLKKSLLQFYHNPVAAVSFELFLSVGAIIFFSVFAIRPTLLTMSDLLKEIKDKEELVGQLERKIAALATVQSEYLQLQDQLPLLDQALPNTPELINSLKIIEKIAQQNQLFITNMVVGTIPEESTTQPSAASAERVNLPVSLTVTSDYPTIRQFIEDLQQNRRSFVIDTIVFSKVEQKGSVSLTATITLYLPYYTTGAKPAAVKGAK